MSTLGLTQEPSPPVFRRTRLRIGVASALSFAALSALILNTVFGTRAALFFLITGGMLLLVRPSTSLQAVLRFRYLLVLPLFCLLSILWSQFPAVTLRYSLQLAITVVIAIVMAYRIPAATFLRCLFGIYSIGLLASLLFGRIRDDIGAWVGIFGSKNAFAAVVSAFALASIAILFDRTAPRLMRLMALAGTAAAGPLLVKAQSTGAMLFTIPAAAVALGIILSRHLNRLQKVALAFLIVTIGLACFIVVTQYADVLFENLLDVSGKDVTLTGRTDLWEFGKEIIREHPLLGVGYQAFWVQDYPPAEMLWAMFDIEARAGFNFHNAYVNNAVEIGLVGLAIEIAILYGALIRTYLWALRAPAPENAFLASFLTLVTCSSFIEVAIFFQFSITTLIVIAAYVYSARAGQELSER